MCWARAGKQRGVVKPTAAAEGRAFGIDVGAGRSFLGRPGIPCLSILQPWAYAICPGPKRIENRTWGEGFAGPLLLHVGKGTSRDIAETRAWFAEHVPGLVLPGRDELPRGVIFAAAFVKCTTRSRWTACTSTDDADPEAQTRFCDRNEGTVYWALRDVVPLQIPINWRGERLVFRVPSAVVADQLSGWTHWAAALAAERGSR